MTCTAMSTVKGWRASCRTQRPRARSADPVWEGPFRDLRLTATMLIVMGIVLGVADRRAASDERGGRHRSPVQRKTLYDLNAKDGLIYGLCQAMALRPRRIPLRSHHQRRSLHGLHPRGRRPLLLPARHPRRPRLRHLRTQGCP
ncbi:hypothetical protein GCM10010377_03920 [Streptomyces viridiviolaceus]|nr:hypothetical protein GCM10010377_03920 [Streptomyces viridiviolaceus]